MIEFNYAFFGLSRSGNHPILNWICNNIDHRPLLFCNCILFFQEEKREFPRSFAQIVSRASEMEYYATSDCKVKYPSNAYSDGTFPSNHFYWSGVLTREAGVIDYIMALPCHTFIHSYENKYLSNFSECWSTCQDKQLDCQIILLRDPFNWIASKYTREIEKGVKGFDYAIWVDYAKEFLNETNHLENKVSISYNHWKNDKEYRDSLAQKIGFENKELVINDVPCYGKASSFDGHSFNKRGLEMKTDERWKLIKDDPQFKSLITPTMVEYSKKIYPDLIEAYEWYDAK